jgi:hypothetical protein
MSIQDHVAKFRKAAIDKGDFAESKADHAFHTEMSEAFRALQLTKAGGDAFEALLGDPSLHVRTWVAAQILYSGGNVTARSILEGVARCGGILAMSARVTLAEYDAGRLGSPL